MLRRVAAKRNRLDHDLRALIALHGWDFPSSERCQGNLLPLCPVQFPTSKGEGHEQHRLVGWRRGHRYRRPEPGRFCL